MIDLLKLGNLFNALKDLFSVKEGNFFVKLIKLFLAIDIAA